ncbi:hypothetical protein ABE25_18415 [Cytobacillus firmus]|uniref:Uncharacterized protein n=1 Tax=Cytobacillus firmus DS1 TaxID=1307436 RepID=W7L0J3_CYTFI|nr:hypothetical protein PBF_23655 [Cytobacillus firmus DS1]MBG9549693.1 hypothetical protein [Cytobacillus firmus]MBG9604053.1 hypothetical protein [Cytobacillus firmus]
MVIQSNMSPEAIIQIWENTLDKIEKNTTSQSPKNFGGTGKRVCSYSVTIGIKFCCRQFKCDLHRRWLTNTIK